MRKRLHVTLSQNTINYLKELSKKKGKPISRLLEEMIFGD